MRPPYRRRSQARVQGGDAPIWKGEEAADADHWRVRNHRWGFSDSLPWRALVAEEHRAVRRGLERADLIKESERQASKLAHRAIEGGCDDDTAVGTCRYEVRSKK